MIDPMMRSLHQTLPAVSGLTARLWAGVDWNAVEGQVDTCGMYHHFIDPCSRPDVRLRDRFPWQKLRRFTKGTKRKAAAARPAQTAPAKGPTRGLIGGENGKVEMSRIFGRQKGWAAPAPHDLESAFFDEEGVAGLWCHCSLSMDLKHLCFFGLMNSWNHAALWSMCFANSQFD